jgi:hypothetical protein
VTGLMPAASRTVAAELYASVQRFYAAQMQLLDSGEAERWAATFTEDGEFGQDKDGQVRRGRAVIAARMRAALERQAGAGVLSRHWIGMVAVDTRADGSVHTEYYALVVRTAHGGESELSLSALCQDVLVPAGESWLVRRRWVAHDGRA